MPHLFTRLIYDNAICMSTDSETHNRLSFGGGHETTLPYVVQMLTHEGDLVWARYTAFLTANGFLASMSGVGFSQSLVQFSMLSLSGILLCSLWWWITKRGLEQCYYYLKKAQEIESASGQCIPFFTELESFRGTHGVRIDNCSLWVIRLFMCLYIAMLFVRLFEPCVDALRKSGLRFLV